MDSHAGSLLRGVFGAALRRIVCLTDAPSCAGCSLQTRCTYSYFLETPIVEEGSLLGKSSAAPHPWLIEPPSGQTYWAAGSPLYFSFVLFGRAHDSLPLCLLAFRRALHQGLGPNRVPLEITGIRLQGDAEWTAVERFSPTLPGPVAPPAAPRSVRMVFETPLRIVRNQRPLRPEDLRFPDFFSALQRRLGLLEALHEGISTDWDYRAGMERAMHCPWEAMGVSWVEQKRYSSRQSRQMLWGGVIGQYRLHDVPEALWPILYRGQWTHAGKNASFGLGKYRLFPDTE